MASMTKILALCSLAIAVLLYVLSVAGAFWPATPPADIGLLSTVLVFVLFGVFGLLLERQRQATA